MTTFVGQRVEIVGTFDPTAPVSPGGLRPIRVVTVRPLGGNCPQ